MLTVLGASGFIGRRLCERLRGSAMEYFAPRREESLFGRTLGDVVYCIGLTADFRTRGFDTVEAHVVKLLTVLRDCDLDSLLYLSSTRLYRSSVPLAREEDALELRPLDPSDLYNISKAMGESLALNCGRSARVARISNVYGKDFESENFLPSIIREAVTQGRVILRSSPDSERDYINVDIVVDGLIQIASRGQYQIYNLASGKNVSTRALVKRLQEITGCAVEFRPDAPDMSFPPIDIERMKTEFTFRGSDILADLPHMVNLHRKHWEKSSGQY